jgi:hypothetical protein
MYTITIKVKDFSKAKILLDIMSDNISGDEEDFWDYESFGDDNIQVEKESGGDQ